MYPVYEPKKIDPPYFMFFTGKGGVGKTSTACATAVSLADDGKRVLLISTDPASNLQDVFEEDFNHKYRYLEAVPRLAVVNLDPEEAAERHREAAIAPYRDKLPVSVINSMEEQLSGACTTEIAAFDSFSSFLCDPKVKEKFDHILFDTAPTGHTLRLLQLPKAWSGFMEKNPDGASCLGSLSALSEKKERYEQAMHTLADRDQTLLALVSRPDEIALYEADRSSKELSALGVENQMLIMNGMWEDTYSSDEVVRSFLEKQQTAIARMPEHLELIYTSQLPFTPLSLTGVDQLRGWMTGMYDLEEEAAEDIGHLAYELDDVIGDLSEKGSGVVFTMGKGGVGKTSIASSVALRLAQEGHRVHLTTTDPADHVNRLFERFESERLRVTNIDPKKKTEAYKRSILNQTSHELSEDELNYLKEDLDSPCTEEIAVFRAFADVVEHSEEEYIVIDTAPTGHTLLLLEAAQSYHREIARNTGDVPESVKNLLPTLRDTEQTHVLIVTLPEATPVYEAERLETDLNRAGLQPKWWIMNQALSGVTTSDPLLKAKAHIESRWMKRTITHASKVAIIPWKKQAILRKQRIL